jgi:hypothetical protein
LVLLPDPKIQTSMKKFNLSEELFGLERIAMINLMSKLVLASIKYGMAPLSVRPEFAPNF